MGVLVFQSQMTNIPKNIYLFSPVASFLLWMALVYELTDAPIAYPIGLWAGSAITVGYVILLIWAFWKLVPNIVRQPMNLIVFLLGSTFNLIILFLCAYILMELNRGFSSSLLP